MDKECIFCNPTFNHTDYNKYGFYTMFDNHPVSRGHTLIISNRHVETYFDLTSSEKEDLLKVLEYVKSDLDETYSPDGYNIGFNCGKASGQTINHFHLHVIPRYNGDVDDPTGGVRGVIPSKQKYCIY